MRCWSQQWRSDPQSCARPGTCLVFLSRAFPPDRLLVMQAMRKYRQYLRAIASRQLLLHLLCKG